MFVSLDGSNFWNIKYYKFFLVPKIPKSVSVHTEILAFGFWAPRKENNWLGLFGFGSLAQWLFLLKAMTEHLAGREGRSSADMLQSPSN